MSIRSEDLDHLCQEKYSPVFLQYCRTRVNKEHKEGSTLKSCNQYIQPNGILPEQLQLGIRELWNVISHSLNIAIERPAPGTMKISVPQWIKNGLSTLHRYDRSQHVWDGIDIKNLKGKRDACADQKKKRLRYFII